MIDQLTILVSGKILNIVKVFFALIAFGWMSYCHGVSQITTYQVGSVGGSNLNSELKVGAYGFKVGFYLGRSGFPKIGKCAIISRNSPNTHIKVGKGSLFYFDNRFYQVTKFGVSTLAKNPVDYVECIELPDEPKKGHVLNKPKRH